MYACVCYISFFYVSCVVFFDFLRVLFVPLAFAHLTLLRRERACARHHFPKEHTVPYLSDTHSHTHTPPPPKKESHLNANIYSCAACWYMWRERKGGSVFPSLSSGPSLFLSPCASLSFPLMPLVWCGLCSSSFFLLARLPSILLFH